MLILIVKKDLNSEDQHKVGLSINRNTMFPSCCVSRLGGMRDMFLLVSGMHCM